MIIINYDEMKKLKRIDLLDMLIEQGKENERLQLELEEALDKLEQREIKINEAGSIAEASLSLSGVFEAAQEAAKKYLENIERLSGEQEKICAQIQVESERKADQLLLETREKCQLLEDETREKCEKMVYTAEQEVTQYWNSLSQKLEDFKDKHKELRELLPLIIQEENKNEEE